MWQAVGKTRYRKIWLEDDILRADDAYEYLWPFTKPELPTEFAKVSDPHSAIRFERRYSPLGYDSLVENPEERKGGDPLEWVLKQAKFVKLAVELIYASAYQDGTSALRQFRYLNITNIIRKASFDSAHRDFGELIFPGGAYNYNYGTIVVMPTSEADALQSVPYFIERLVNENTKNLQQKLVVHYKGRLGSVLFYNALIEAIWSMVGDLALKTQQGQESGYFKRCEYKECNTPFLATDKRQRFCPRPEEAGDGESLCGLKFRQHNLQTRGAHRQEGKECREVL